MHAPPSLSAQLLRSTQAGVALGDMLNALVTLCSAPDEGGEVSLTPAPPFPLRQCGQRGIPRVWRVVVMQPRGSGSRLACSRTFPCAGPCPHRQQQQGPTVPRYVRILRTLGDLCTALLGRAESLAGQSSGKRTEQPV